MSHKQTGRLVQTSRASSSQMNIYFRQAHDTQEGQTCLASGSEVSAWGPVA